jgi:rhomboid protease GluP
MNYYTELPAEHRLVRLPLATNHVWATWVLLTLNILIFVASVVFSIIVLSLNGIPLGNPLTPVGGVLELMGWKNNALIYNGEYWRLLTAMFLHGGLLHIVFNGFALYVLGPEAERIYGVPRFLAIYFVAGLAGGIASYVFSPHNSVGASGAIFGLIGCLAIFFATARDMLGDVGKRQLQGMIGIILINIIIGLSASNTIDNYAHMGGLVGGAACAWLLVPCYELDRRFYPPVIERRVNRVGWWGVVGILFFLVAVTVTVTPIL